MSIILLLEQTLNKHGFGDSVTLKLAANKWLIDKIIGGETSQNVEEDLQEIEVILDQGENTSEREEDYLSSELLV